MPNEYLFEIGFVFGLVDRYLEKKCVDGLFKFNFFAVYNKY